MDRIYELALQQHFSNYRQMAFLIGPRQVGKTTIGRNNLKEKGNNAYLNWDEEIHREVILAGTKRILEFFHLDIATPQKKIIIFDELHKYRHWRNFLKGFFDINEKNIHILVTGSARLDAFRYGGDSLMGRYFSYRIHPLSVREISAKKNQFTLNQELSEVVQINQEKFQHLVKFGGFPEPFLTGTNTFYNRWYRLREQQLFEEDLRDLSRIHDLSRLKFVAKAIFNQAGELVTYSNLAKLAKVSIETIQNWLTVLENIYYCFFIRPWHTNITRSLIKQPKIYLWDWASIVGAGARNENFVASHLLKAVNFWTDLGLGEYDLYFLRDKEQREVDFLVTKANKPWFLVEVKTSAKEPISKSLEYFQKQTKSLHAFQVVIELPFVDIDCFSYTTPIKVPASTFLSQLV